MKTPPAFLINQLSNDPSPAAREMRAKKKTPIEQAIDREHAELAARLRTSSGTNPEVLVTHGRSRFGECLLLDVHVSQSTCPTQGRTVQATIRCIPNSSGIPLVILNEKTFVSPDPGAILAIICAWTP